jgi:cysteine-rich repeat protein
VLLLWSASAEAADYYVRPTGSDSASGTSIATAWQSIAKVNSRNFGAGDRIHFEGGQSFSGSLYFDAQDTGSAVSPIVVTSYGSGRATITAAAGDGLFAYNTAGLTISSLVFTGSGAATNTKSGVIFYNDLPGNVRLPHVYLDDLDVSGFRNGISIGGWNGTSGYDDVRVTGTAAHHNQRGGMSTYSQANFGITNVYVGGSSFYSNLGDPNYTANNSGNGLVLGQVDGALIERCLAWDNGGLCPASAGPVGIWAYESTDVTIQFCESFSNRTGGPADGGGFDLDGGVTNSVMQYNYSHDNDGAGYGLYQYPGASAWSGNVVRYNISQNDGRKNSYGGVTVWNGGSGVTNAEIYNNTIYVSPASSGTAHGIRFLTGSTNLRFRNNIILATAGAPLLRSTGTQTGLVFQGNDYYTYGGLFRIFYGAATYTTFDAFVAATGHEKVGAQTVGRNVDPLITLPGAGGTVSDPDALQNLAAYRLTAASPLVNGGLDLATFGVTPGIRDFYGGIVPVGAYDVGAHELQASSECGNAAIETGEQCDDGNVTSGDCCSSGCQLEASTTVCRAAGGPCDVAETCSGSSAGCPMDGFAASSTTCRSSAGVCDLAEKCSGAAAGCPADALVAVSTTCRDAAGVCDVAESCSGSAASCPADILAASTSICRSSAGICDSQERCSGSAPICPSDAFAASNVICRSSAGVCDESESCGGTSPSCPGDLLAASGTLCRSSTDVCDLEENCDGASAQCPLDSGLPDSDADSVCDAGDLCPGTPDVAQSDGDGDFAGDACDVCTNVAPTTVARPRLVVSRLLSFESDDTLKMKLEAAGVPASPPIDPLANGLRVLVTSASGAEVLDATLLPGAYDPDSRAGWSESRTSWRYRNAGKVAPAPGGVSRVSIKSVTGTPGSYKISVTAGDGSFDTAVALPLRVDVVFTPPLGWNGQCVEVDFSGTTPEPTCVLTSRGGTVKCE